MFFSFSFIFYSLIAPYMGLNITFWSILSIRIPFHIDYVEGMRSLLIHFLTKCAAKCAFLSEQ